ncbi:hypothetical protein PENTCL1PPCAC_16611, partial [Pristionchus entomophagus]
FSEIMSDRCCFGALSIMAGAKILAVVTILGAVGQLLLIFSGIFHLLLWYKIASVIFGIFGLLVAILVFVACEKQRAALMKPMFAYCIIAPIFYALVTFASLADFFSPYIGTAFTISFVVIASIEVAFFAWSFTVFRNCFKFLVDNESSLMYGEV